MATLTEEELETIKQNPLGDTLIGVREALRGAERNSPRDAAGSDACDSRESPERTRLFVAAIDKLLLLLMASNVSLALASRTGSDALASDLVAVCLRVRKGDFEYQHLRPLSQLVVKQAPDVDIWAATVALIRIVCPSSPPPSRTHSSASQQSSEQIRRQIEEIRHCTYRGVQGFHETYFEGKIWNRRAKRVWQKVQGLYSKTDAKWSQLSDSPTQDEICGFWLDIQQQHLAKDRSAFFRSTVKNQVGSCSPRQLDLFSKKRGNGESVKHEWKDVLVVGELKESGQKTQGLLWLQMGSAVRNVFASQPMRLFVHAFTLTGTEMETWVFDRSGPYSGTTFDIHEEPEKFINIMCGYLMMSDEELGLDTFTQTKETRRFVTLPEARGSKRKLQLELEPDPIAHQRAIVCRGTTCFRAKAAGTTEFDSVVKYSWTSSTRPPEADLLSKASDRGIKGIARLVAYQEEVTSISRLRKGFVFSTPHKFRGVPHGAHTCFSQSQPPRSYSANQLLGPGIVSTGSGKRKCTDELSRASKRPRPNSQLAEAERREGEVTYPVQEPQGTSLVQETTTSYDNRILRVLAISPAGRSISQFGSVTELLEGLRDAIRVHRSLYTDGGILHRDISENNIIITDPGRADGFRGMLIDLDLAKEEGKGPGGARHRTGTMEFMAIEVLQGILHTYRHDLESFLYVLLWLCARRAWALPGAPKRPTAGHALSHWYTGTYDDIARSKRGDMDLTGLEVVLKEFPSSFDCVKPLCRTLRDVLFPYKVGRGLFTGTPQDSTIRYDPITRAFETAIADI